MRHVSGDENVVANALSRIIEMQSPMNYSALAISQETDEEQKNMTKVNPDHDLKRSMSPEQK